MVICGSPTGEVTPRMDQGARLGGRYRLDERIGAGGMGEVWRGTDEILGRTVAVKVVLPLLASDPEFVRRFLAEARAMASVSHPGVVSIHDYGQDPAGAYLVMEYVESEPLSRALGRIGRLNPGAAMHVVAQAAIALQAVHDKGIVHRDVKPANLLVRPDGAVALTDFGVAFGGGTALTSSGALLGTPSYLSPEQVLGEPATARSDVYALGVVAYECLTGRRPFEAESPYAVAIKRVHEPPPPMDGDIPLQVRAVVERALATDPGRRWRSAADLAHSARAVQLDVGPTAVLGRDGGPTTLLPEAATVRTARGMPRRLIIWVAVLLFAVAAVAGFTWQRGLWPPRAEAVQSGPTSTVGSGAGGPIIGFAPCGPAVCPVEPMCWGGLTLTGGVAQEIRRIDCAVPHYWETFAGGPLAAELALTPQETLITRPEIASACAESVLADRSVDPDRTQGWQREPWPIQVDPGTWVFHCLAAPREGGERTGSEFRAQ
jgi:eukaryotic-like serine/threonine-protein kinase